MNLDGEIQAWLCFGITGATHSHAQVSHRLVENVGPRTAHKIILEYFLVFFLLIAVTFIY